MYKLAYILFLLFTFYSCILPSEESLFEPGDQSLVIEGRITNSSDVLNHVVITKSVNGDSKHNFEPINNALVRIKNEETGIRETLEWYDNGKYILNSMIGNTENEYKLEVFYDGVLYESFEKMPTNPNISSVTISYQNRKPFDSGYYIYFKLGKRIDTIGYYKVDISINDSLLNGYSDFIVFEDRLFSKVQIYKVPKAFEINDKVKVCIYGLSESVYEYYMQLSKQTTNLFSNIQPPTTNPNNNVFPDVLGYFQASSVHIIDTVIEEPVN